MKITDVIAHPLRAVPAKMQRTGTRDFPAFELVIVEIHTDSGVQGWGECLGRVGAVAYAAVVERVLKPLLIGQNPLDIARHWDRMRRALSGRSGGMLLEAIAGCDIALWDIAGKIAGLPIHRLLGSMGRTHLDCYASSINWASDEEAAEETRAALALGFRQIKVKIGKPVARAIERCRQIRDIAGPDIRLMVDSNWAYDVDETVQVARGLERLDYFWFEEPIPCEDIEGYRLLARKLDIRIAAGESEFTAWSARDLIQHRAVGVIQPDVARSGGISEAKRIADLAHAFHVAYAPHVGWSGAVCVAAGLQIAAACPNFLTFECMVAPNPLRESLTVARVGDSRDLIDGQVTVPTGPGLGIEIDRDVLERHRIR